MPNKNPRIQVTFSEETNAMIAILAERKGMSLSAVTSDLVESALDLEEDFALSKLADSRDGDTSRVSHAEAWG